MNLFQKLLDVWQFQNQNFAGWRRENLTRFGCLNGSTWVWVMKSHKRPRYISSTAISHSNASKKFKLTVHMSPFKIILKSCAINQKCSYEHWSTLSSCFYPYCHSDLEMSQQKLGLILLNKDFYKRVKSIMILMKVVLLIW